MQHKLALSDNEIKDLRAAGYTVDLATDTPGAGYVWRHLQSGASQLRATKQPSRRTAAQAWHDLSLYLSPDGPDTPRPDWIQK
jgi:hypothetical protein